MISPLNPINISLNRSQIPLTYHEIPIFVDWITIFPIQIPMIFGWQSPGSRPKFCQPQASPWASAFPPLGVNFSLSRPQRSCGVTATPVGWWLVWNIYIYIHIYIYIDSSYIYIYTYIIYTYTWIFHLRLFSDPVPKSCFFSTQKTFQDLLSNSGPGHFGVSMVMAIIGCKHVKPTFGGYIYIYKHNINIHIIYI